MPITLVTGLGNPGRDYQDTRHNLGWVLIDAFAREKALAWAYQSRFEAEVAVWKHPGSGRTVYFAKPLTYMNESGRAVAALTRYYRLAAEQVALVYDEYTIDLGRAKLSASGSAGGHNGVASVLQHLGAGFVRYRLGIGPKTAAQMDIKDFVLGKFTAAQQSLLLDSLPHFLKGLDLLLDSGVEVAMNQINRKETTPTNHS
ncbi:aminoacyl-tRNA hydrolase [Cephaloticoccus primus]|uniref:Peptidyl-tRNA hydrolase n=1 Tax=Cephaloticoccus primus TaxID=1548207 RepID=A0A139SKC8_9BACT|nr:aminoacyl-tRNA hydrolase [Cephaloticoccus primus]